MRSEFAIEFDKFRKTSAALREKGVEIIKNFAAQKGGKFFFNNSDGLYNLPWLHEERELYATKLFSKDDVIAIIDNCGTIKELSDMDDYAVISIAAYLENNKNL